MLTNTALALSDVEIFLPEVQPPILLRTLGAGDVCEYAAHNLANADGLVSSGQIEADELPLLTNPNLLKHAIAPEGSGLKDHYFLGIFAADAQRLIGDVVIALTGDDVIEVNMLIDEAYRSRGIGSAVKAAGVSLAQSLGLRIQAQDDTGDSASS